MGATSRHLMSLAALLLYGCEPIRDQRKLQQLHDECARPHIEKQKTPKDKALMAHSILWYCAAVAIERYDKEVLGK